MCTFNKNQIVEKIDEHLGQSIKPVYSDFFIGATKNIQERFNQHFVRQNSWWIYLRAESTEIAREVVNYYKEKGMHTSDVSFEDGGDIVYCYGITSLTVENIKMGEE